MLRWQGVDRVTIIGTALDGIVLTAPHSTAPSSTAPRRVIDSATLNTLDGTLDGSARSPAPVQRSIRCTRTACPCMGQASVGQATVGQATMGRTHVRARAHGTPGPGIPCRGSRGYVLFLLHTCYFCRYFQSRSQK